MYMNGVVENIQFSTKAPFSPLDVIKSYALDLEKFSAVHKLSRTLMKPMCFFGFFFNSVSWAYFT